MFNKVSNFIVNAWYVLANKEKMEFISFNRSIKIIYLFVYFCKRRKSSGGVYNHLSLFRVIISSLSELPSQRWVYSRSGTCI